MFELEEKCEMGEYYMLYKTTCPCSVFDMIELIQKAGFSITNIKLKEIADVGSYYFGGNYSLEGFYEVYGSINKNDLEEVIIDFGDGYRLFVKDDIGEVSLVCEQETDLNDILRLKESTKEETYAGK